MTDLDEYVKLYKRFGIDCIVNIDENGNKYIQLSKMDCWSGENEEATLSDKFDGYGDFYSIITFSKDGEFIKQGFWE